MKKNPVPQSTDSYDLLPIERIYDNSTTDFDLYLKVRGGIALYAGKGYYWVRDELESLLRSKYRHFLIKSTDKRNAGMYLRISKLPEINTKLTPHERIASIEQVGSQFIKCLYDGEITGSCVSKAKQIGQCITDCVREDRSCIKAISSLADHDYYTYYHSIRVASYAVAIATEMGLDDQKMIQDIALGGIFHDIGKKSIGSEIVNKSGSLTEDEWKKMRAHPEMGHKYIHNSSLSLVPQEIILHHHEKLDGSGYPHGLEKGDLLTEVQIASLADVFDALTSTRSYQNKRSRFEALNLIKDKMIGSHLPAEPFKALISCLK